MADVDQGRQDETRGPSTSEGRAPLEDACRLGGMVGMGYFPDEVDLPAEWPWATDRGEGSPASMA
jgi:hypothetical protein